MYINVRYDKLSWSSLKLLPTLKVLFTEQLWIFAVSSISCIRSTVPVCPLVLCSLSLSVPDRLKLNTSCFQEMTA